MTLPRYIRGRIGQLDHTTINEAFDVIERAEKGVRANGSKIAQAGQRRLPLGPYLGQITARSGTTNATYDVQTLFWPHFSASSLTPVNRTFSTADVTYNAAAVNDLCEIYVEEDQSTISVVVHETIDTTDCQTTTANAEGIMNYIMFR